MPKRPIHIWSQDGSGLPLALRLQRDGHEVTWYARSVPARRVGRGLVRQMITPPPSALVVFDCVGAGQEGAKYRSEGHPVIGGHPLDASLEVHRASGARIMREAGIVTPPTFPFSTIPSAVKFLREAPPGGWFVKVSGDVGEASTFDTTSAERMIAYLTWMAETGTVRPFELQQTVAGVEVSVNGWFDGKRFVPPFELTLEDKRFLAGGHGPRTGCESCVVWHASDEALARQTLRRVEPVLARNHYVGPLDLNTIVTPDGTPHGLEWTARLGFDATEAWMRLFDGTLGEQMEAFAVGELDRWEPRGGFVGTLRVTVPPYPTWHEPLLKGLVGMPLDPRVLQEPFDPVDVMQGPRCAGSSGIIGTMAVHQESPEGMPTALLALVKDLEIPNMQYRMDPLVDVPHRLERLTAMKLAGV